MSTEVVVFNEKHYEEINEKAKADPNYYKSLFKPLLPTKDGRDIVYLNMKFGVGNENARKPGYFTVFSEAGIPIRGISPITGVKTNDEMRLSFGFKRSQCQPFGDAYITLSKSWSHNCNQLLKEINAKKDKGDKLTTNEGLYLYAYSAKGIAALYRDTLSMKNKANPGKKLDDELINFKFAFGTFPAKHPYGNEGESTIEIYDANTKKPRVAGKSFDSYERASVSRTNPVTGEVVKEPITEANIHEFIKAGSSVRLIKWAMNPTGSSYGINCANKVWKMVIKPGNGNAGAGEEEAEEEEIEEPVKPVVQPTVVNEPTKKTSDEAAEDLIDDL